MDEIIQTVNDRGGTFNYLLDGAILAEVAFTMDHNQQMIIDHTEVDETLQGQGIGKKLLANLVDYARENNIRVIPMCNYAKLMFDRTDGWQDVLSGR